MNVDIQEQLSCYSDELLDNEVQRRAEVGKMSEAPRRLMYPDITKLSNACHAHLREVANDRVPDDDGEHDIYVAAMEAMYGEKVFDWIYIRET